MRHRIAPVGVFGALALLIAASGGRGQAPPNAPPPVFGAAVELGA